MPKEWYASPPNYQSIDAEENAMEIQKAKDCKTVDEVYACLKELEEDKKMIHGPEELDQLEQAIMSYTNRLAALLVKKKSKQS